MRFHRCSAESSDSQDLVKLYNVIGGFADEKTLDSGSGGDEAGVPEGRTPFLSSFSIMV